MTKRQILLEMTGVAATEIEFREDVEAAAEYIEECWLDGNVDNCDFETIGRAVDEWQTMTETNYPELCGEQEE